MKLLRSSTLRFSIFAIFSFVGFGCSKYRSNGYDQVFPAGSLQNAKEPVSSQQYPSQTSATPKTPESQIPSTLPNQPLPPRPQPLPILPTPPTTVTPEPTTPPVPSTPPISVVPNPPSQPPQVPVNVLCRPRLSNLPGTGSVVFGGSVSEIIYCSNLTNQTQVRIVGTKNGLPDIDEVISVTTPVVNPYYYDNYGHFSFSATRTHFDSEKQGLYRRKVIVKDINSGAILFTSEEWTYEFMSDFGCSFAIVESSPGFISETASCQSLPSGAIVRLLQPNNHGDLIQPIITLPYEVTGPHNEAMLLAGANPNYMYSRTLEVTNASRTIYYFSKSYTFYFRKQKP